MHKTNSKTASVCPERNLQGPLINAESPGTRNGTQTSKGNKPKFQVLRESTLLFIPQGRSKLQNNSKKLLGPHSKATRTSEAAVTVRTGLTHQHQGLVFLKAFSTKKLYYRPISNIRGYQGRQRRSSKLTYQHLQKRQLKICKPSDQGPADTRGPGAGCPAPPAMSL